VQPIQYATSENIISSDVDFGSPAWLSGWGDSENPLIYVVDMLRAVEIPI
jgi:hypothetical protein